MSRLVRKGRWVGGGRNWTRRMYIQELESPMPEPERLSYAEWLVAQLGRPMERAMIRASQRYEKQKRRLISVHHLHVAYRAKRR